MPAYKVVVVGDPHAHPDYDNKRFDCLGQFILDEKPDEVLCMGDFRDMPSLCKHSSKSELDGARAMADLMAASDAESRLFAPIRQFNSQRKAMKKSGLKTKFTLLQGNHDVRIDLIATHDPRLTDLIEAPWAKDWDEIVPFKEVYNLAGLDIACAHYFVSGQMEKPLGGLNMGRKLVLKNHVSTIVGHSHLLEYHEEPTAFGKKLFALSAGHYGHLDYKEGWCLQSRAAWWNGVCVLELDKVGQVLEKRFVRQEVLHDQYA